MHIECRSGPVTVRAALMPSSSGWCPWPPSDFNWVLGHTLLQLGCASGHPLLQLGSGPHSASTGFWHTLLQLGCAPGHPLLACRDGRERLQAIQHGRQEYYEGYKVDLDNRKQQMKEAEERRRAAEMAKIREDIASGIHGEVKPIMGAAGDTQGDDED